MWIEVRDKYDRDDPECEMLYVWVVNDHEFEVYSCGPRTLHYYISFHVSKEEFKECKGLARRMRC